MPSNSPALPLQSSPPDRRGSRGLFAVLVLAALLRVLWPSSFHVEHYDEGVYASNRWFTPEEGARYPDRHLYAPPLWPAILEISQLALGPSPLGVMLPGILCGVVSVWLIWKIVIAWVGPKEALASAIILSLSGYHILFSRTALTDIPVTMWMLGAIYLAWKSLDQERLGIAVAAGLLTGLAWSTKYNGWFPLAVSGTGLLAANLFHVKRVSIAWRKWRCWGIMFMIAVTVWSPAWLDLQEAGRGGYSAVATNHAGYVEGWSSWLPNLRRQFENMRWWDLPGSWLGRFSIPFFCLFLSLLGLGERLIKLVRAAWDQEPIDSEILSGWMTLAWVTSLLLMTPLYRPYPRLAMPLFLALVMGAGYGFGILRNWGWPAEAGGASEDQEAVSRETWLSRGWGVVALFVSLFVIGGPLAPGKGIWPWMENRLSAESISADLIDDCQERFPQRVDRPIAYVLYVYSEPAVFYHLCRLAPENVLISPVSSLGFVNQPPANEPVPILLIAGPHADRNSTFRNELKKVGGRLELLTEMESEVSQFVSLNAHDPREYSEAGDEFPPETFRLWQVSETAYSISP